MGTRHRHPGPRRHPDPFRMRHPRRCLGTNACEGTGEECRHVRMLLATNGLETSAGRSISGVALDGLQPRPEMLKVIKGKFLLQPHQRYDSTQYEELGFSSATQMRDDYSGSSHYIT